MTGIWSRWLKRAFDYVPIFKKDLYVEHARKGFLENAFDCLLDFKRYFRNSELCMCVRF